jgi:hypothetical protein
MRPYRFIDRQDILNLCAPFFKGEEMLGKPLIVFLFVLMCAVPVAAQQVVNEASNMMWNYDTTVTHVAEFRIYVSDTPGIVPGVAPNDVPTRSVAFPTLSSVIIEPARTAVYYAVCTAYSTDGVESGPSNEISFIVLGNPQNFRISDLMDAKVGMAAD